MGTGSFTICTVGLVMSGCVGIGSGSDAGKTQLATTQALVERDVEAPEVFQVSDRGICDGRPSLGGVWVAHPTTGEQALRLQSATPARLSGAALRREEQGSPLSALAPLADDATPDVGPSRGKAQTLETQTLPPLAPVVAAARPATTAAQSAVAPTSPLATACIQIGIFSLEQNATNTATALRNAGPSPTINMQRTAGKTVYRVTIGPARTSAARAANLNSVKALAFSDAYFVSG